MLEDGKGRGVVRQNAELSSHPGQDDNIHVSLKDGSILRNNFTTYGHRGFSGFRYQIPGNLERDA
jgi:hypothetical protein